MDESDTDANQRGTQGSATQDTTRAEEMRREARSHFETPSWMGERLNVTDPPAPAQVPSQTVPAHDLVARPSEGHPDGVLEDGTWTEHAKPRLIGGMVLLVATIGAVVALVVAISTQSVVAMVALAVCAVVAIIFRGALMSTGVTHTTLHGATLTVRRDGVQEKFNLADPYQQVEVVGTAGSAHWRLRLGALGGRTVELTPAQVDAVELMPTIAYYQERAAREREDRERRFNR